jgi:hypothetical protein
MHHLWTLLNHFLGLVDGFGHVVNHILLNWHDSGVWFVAWDAHINWNLDWHLHWDVARNALFDVDWLLLDDLVRDTLLLVDWHRHWLVVVNGARDSLWDLSSDTAVNFTGILMDDLGWQALRLPAVVARVTRVARVVTCIATLTRTLTL